jgi:hypothetical protein
MYEVRSQAAPPARPWRRPEAGELGERRRDVGGAGQTVDRGAHRHARPRQDQRHASCPGTEQQAVGRLSLVAQHLAVVADHRDHRPRRQRGEQPTDLVVEKGDLPVVEPVGSGRRVGEARRGPILLVRIVEVNPEEERRPQRREPGQRGAGRRLGVPLGDLRPLGVARAQIVVVHREPLVEPVPAGENHRRDHRRRVVAGGGQAFGHALDRRAEDEGAVVAHSVPGREEPGQDRGMRRQGDRRRGVATRESCPAPRERVEVRRSGVWMTPGAEVVGAGRVQRDQDQVGPLLRVRGGADRRRREPAGQGEKERAGRPGRAGHGPRL